MHLFLHNNSINVEHVSADITLVFPSVCGLVHLTYTHTTPTLQKALSPFAFTYSVQAISTKH